MQRETEKRFLSVLEEGSSLLTRGRAGPTSMAQAAPRRPRGISLASTVHTLSAGLSMPSVLGGVPYALSQDTE